MIENLEIINPLLQHLIFYSLILIGMCSLVMGLNIYNMNRKQIANQKGLGLCICSFLWYSGYGWILVSVSKEMVYTSRFIGMVGVYMWITMALAYFFEMGLAKRHRQFCTVLMMIMIVISLMIAIQAYQPSDITVLAAPFGVTFQMNQNIHKIIRYIYIGMIIIFANVVVVKWYQKSELKRNKRAGIYFIIAVLLFPIGGVFDAILPFFGQPIFPASCYTSFLATCILYVVTKQNNAFSISMENVAKYVTESVRTPFFVLGCDCEITLMNRSAREFLGRSVQNTQYNNCDIFFQSEDTLISEEIQKRIKLHTTDFNLQGECISNQAICNLQFTVVYDRFDECMCIIMLVTDISNEYEVIQKLKKSQQAEERANHAKSIFLANMSHEIRTPINTILGMDEMIIRETHEEVTREYATNIQNSGKMLMSLINDILDFSRIESGKMEIVSEEYEVSSLLNDVVNMATIKSEDKGLHFEIEIDENIPHLLYGDEMRIRQIITNIVNNAIKYTQKGQVSLSMGWKLISPNKLELLIDVVDTGIGIKKEDMDKMFLSFERLEPKKNRSIEGSGLGLSITGRLLELMRGKMQLESEYGKGSSFHIIIPQKIMDYEPMGNYKAMYDKSIQQKRVYQESFTAPNAKILVVDDNDMNLAVVKGFLKKTKVQLTMVTSGQACLEALTRETFHIVFMDHMMPQMDGVETLKQIRNKYPQVYQTVPIIALTANALSGARERYLSWGFTDYLAKPIESIKMEDMLLQYLPTESIIHE